MIIGTTPTFTLRLKRTYDINLNSAQNIYVTFKQGNTTLTKTRENLLIVDSKTLQVTLTQEESLSFSIDKKVEVQLNWTYYDQGIAKRAATKVVTVNLEKQLLTQVLT